MIVSINLSSPPFLLPSLLPSFPPSLQHIRRYATGFAHQFRVVSQRVFVAVIRNPATSVFQVLSFVASAVLLGAFFHGRLDGGPTAMQGKVG